MSPECRTELQSFARTAAQLGVKQLVLPLVYVDLPALHDEKNQDDLVRLVSTFQWEDWTDLRFADVSAEGYRRGVARLASRLVEANRQLERVQITSMTLQPDVCARETSDDSPGFLDRMAAFEEAVPKLNETTQAIGREFATIGLVMRQANADVTRSDGEANPLASRLLVARRLARQLTEPAQRVLSLGNEFASQLHQIDDGVRAFIDRAEAEIRQNPESSGEVRGNFESIRILSVATRDGLTSAQAMIDTIAPLEQLSRDLRPVLRRLRQGLTTMVEAKDVSEEWVRLIGKSGIACNEPTVESS